MLFFLNQSKSPSKILNMEDSLVGKSNVRVRLRADPMKNGVTTGKTKRVRNRTLIEVEFGPGERKFKREQELEIIPTVDEKLTELLLKRRWGGPDKLRGVLSLQKVSGELTNVFYSMESSRTDFYSHQFMPVMKFVESPTGRILIADEVGLGKTIEAIYIWKEIEAREQANRWLIICPAMLREKWRDDLHRLFGIEADIVDARILEDRLVRARSSGTSNFVLIASFEAARPTRDYEDEEEFPRKSPSRNIARLLRAVSEEDDEPLIDLTVIDEAHYMRNSSSLNHSLGKLLSDASRHFVLLTATPVQIGSKNLFNLMRLLDPNSFEHQRQFDSMLQANSSIIEAQRQVWRDPPNLTAAAEALQKASKNHYFFQDPVLLELCNRLNSTSNLSPAQRVGIGRQLEARSLISPYITRSRKRDVIPDRVLRQAQTLRVEFNAIERQTYDHITRILRNQSKGLERISVFALISRQRAMASSLPAALHNWNEKTILSELAWGDYGGLTLEASEEASEQGIEPISIDRSLAEELERSDSKYLAVRNEFLSRLLRESPKEKLIIFAFFRGTLTYLRRRLEADGFSTLLIMGGDNRSREERNAVLEKFADPDGPSILLSSEVGSEGIDLQFCRNLVNYDLPWNPMKVEQRIGRIDRLGQQAERISIVNLFVEDTIEDRILERLYDRIGIFKETIGDLEQILGEVSQELLEGLFDPSLTDAERDQLADQKLQAIENRKQQQEQLESQAANLFSFSDYLIDSINDARKAGRWLSPREIFTFVDDFFGSNFPGTLIEPIAHSSFQAKIKLSSDARQDFVKFIEQASLPRQNRLYLTGKLIGVFDPKASGILARDSEIIGPTHPLLRWIEFKRSNEDTPGAAAVGIELSHKEVSVPPELYAFACQRWNFRGVRRESIISYQARGLSSRTVLNSIRSEDLVVTASRFGRTLPYGAVSEHDIGLVEENYKLCEKGLDEEYDDRLSEFELENENRARQQKIAVESLTDRKVSSLEQRIQKLRGEGKEKAMKLFTAQIEKQRQYQELKLQRIRLASEVTSDMTDIVGGLILVT